MYWLLYVLNTIRHFGTFLNVKTVYTSLSLGLVYVFFDNTYHADVFTALLALSVGFYLFHLTQIRRVIILRHHIATISVLSYLLRYGDGEELANVTVGIVGGSLITEPLEMFKEFLKDNGMYSGTLRQVVRWTFACSFGGIRLLGFGFYIVKYFFSPGMDVIIQTFVAVLFYTSAVFSLRIFEIAYKDLL